MSKLWVAMAGFILTFFFVSLSWASLLRDVELQNHALTTTRQSSLLDCSAACLVDTCCLSFNFFQPTLECQLNSRTKEQNPSDFVPKKGSFNRNKDDITPVSQPFTVITTTTSSSKSPIHCNYYHCL